MKRYAYFRNEHGKLDRRDIKVMDGSYVEILAEIGRIAKVNGTSVSYTGWHFQKLRAALMDALAIVGPDGQELNRSDTKTLAMKSMGRAVIAAGAGKPIRASVMLHELNELSAAFFRDPEVEYHLMTQLSVAVAPFKRLKLPHSQLSLHPRRHRSYVYPSDLPPDGQSAVKRAMAAGWQATRIVTRGRSIYDAFDRALSDLNLLMAMWSFLTQFKSNTMSFGGMSRKPIARINAGPVYTLHHPDGKLATNIFWFEPHFDLELNAYSPPNGWVKIEKDRRWAMRRLAVVPYADDLKRFFTRYAKAIGETDYDATLLQMWGLLEVITDTVGAKYEQLIERAVWTYRDRRLARELLSSTRIVRNRMVHSAERSADPEQAAYLVKSFVDDHLLRLLRNELGVSSIREYAECLGLPTGVEELEKRTMRYSKAAAFRRAAERTGRS